MAEKQTNTSPDVPANFKCVTEDAAGAIGIKEGLVVLLGASGLAMTLALPTAGADDGKELTIIDGSGNAHTVTTPTNGINGGTHIGTFGGTKGQGFTLRAYGGVWYVNPTISGGVTLS